MKKTARNEIRRELHTVEKKLTKATTRLVEDNKDMIAVVQDRIRKLQDRRDDLKRELAPNGKSRKQLLAEVNHQFGEAVRKFAQLRHYFENADIGKLREL
jgi:chromosome segregation ATPase